MTKGDCFLKGKGAQITAYLKKLKAAADACKKELPALWTKTKQAKKNLEVTVDGLPIPDPDMSFFTASGSCNDLSGGGTGAMDVSDPAAKDSLKYSMWLKNLTDDTAEYCAMVHEILKPLANACAQTATEVQCELNKQTANGITDAQKKSYHLRITMAMKAATLQYNNLDSYYKNVIVKGQSDFTSVYKEKNISCGGSNSSGMGGDLYKSKEAE